MQCLFVDSQYEFSLDLVHRRIERICHINPKPIGSDEDPLERHGEFMFEFCLRVPVDTPDAFPREMKSPYKSNIVGEALHQLVIGPDVPIRPLLEPFIRCPNFKRAVARIGQRNMLAG